MYFDLLDKPAEERAAHLDGCPEKRCAAKWSLYLRLNTPPVRFSKRVRIVNSSTPVEEIPAVLDPTNRRRC